MGASGKQSLAATNQPAGAKNINAQITDLGTDCFLVANPFIFPLIDDNDDDDDVHEFN